MKRWGGAFFVAFALHAAILLLLYRQALDMKPDAAIIDLSPTLTVEMIVDRDDVSPPVVSPKEAEPVAAEPELRPVPEDGKVEPEEAKPDEPKPEPPQEDDEPLIPTKLSEESSPEQRQAERQAEGIPDDVVVEEAKPQEDASSASNQIADANESKETRSDAASSGSEKAAGQLMFEKSLKPGREGAEMDRIVQGDGPRLSAGIRQELLRDTGNGPKEESAKERGERRIREWATIRWRPNKDIERGRRVLKKTARGGYQYVDARTGEAQGALGDEAKGDKLPPMSGEGRYAADSFHGEWARRKPERPDLDNRDDLVLRKDGGFDFNASGFAARIRPNGQVMFAENLASIEFGRTSKFSEDLALGYGRDLTSGTFDATDMLMRLAGEDPYISAKMRFLEDTWEIRLELKKNFEAANIEHVIIFLRRRLDAILKERPGRASHRVLFELWDECMEGPQGDLARQFIIRFVRVHLPSGTSRGYKMGDLDELNTARRSKQPFEPYKKP